MKGAIYVVLYILIGVCKGQYISINPKPSSLSPCDNLSSTVLIERFFDLIFTEFHNTPPACICIQICLDHPTYCYPNGCLKRTERKKVEETTYLTNPAPKANYEGTTKIPTFGIDHRAIVDDLLERPGLLTAYADTTEKPMNNLIHRPNPFKELVLKYKKVPKLQMKYNLREQVKNTKSDKLNKEKNIDISKTRWPLNKHLLHGKSPFHRVRGYKKAGDTKNARFFISMFPDYDPLSYSPVYYKKYLAKRENNKEVNVETIYLYQTETANFTLETLIDNLIESDLDKSKIDTKRSFNTKVDDIVKQITATETNTNLTELNFLLDEENETNSILNNTSVSIISMNLTNENTDTNKYSHDTNSTNQNMLLEMIASMTNEIEKQNKASMELFERLMGAQNVSNESTTYISILFNKTSNNLSETESNVKKSNVTEENNTKLFTEDNIYNGNFYTTKNPVLVTKSTAYKKTQQRISRKLKRRKAN